MIKFISVFGLIILGVFISAFVTVWKKIKTDGFSVDKFFKDNAPFWVVCSVLGLLLSIGIAFVEGFEAVINNLGFAKYEDTEIGFVLLGISLAITSDKTILTGNKTLISKSPEKDVK